ncbi:MAG TPA: toprim domain-containing protein, partial [Burkholderiales bacterium]|nr:toprim domain-containing protein [Burkholderiales bacterium]
RPFRWPGIDWIPALRPAFSAIGAAHDPTTGFRAALSRRGIIVPRDVIADGRVHRCDAEGRFGQGAAVYSLHLEGVAVGGFRNWRDNLGWELWQAPVGRPLRTGEQVAQQLKAEAIQHALEVEELERRAQVLRRAAEIFKAAEPATSNHPYLKRKRVGAHGLQVRAGTLIVPVRDPDDELRSLQFIREGAGKKFLIGGTVEGCYFAIGKPDGVLCVAEDYATGASIFEATGYAVAVAFSAQNLEPVARALRVKFPRIRLIVCADDDASKTGNPGLTHAIAAARAVGALLAVPDFGPDRPRHATNFNDLARARGHHAVKRAISPAQGLIDLADRQAAAGYPSAATAN